MEIKYGNVEFIQLAQDAVSGGLSWTSRPTRQRISWGCTKLYDT